tara:strand:+ start:195 stop:1025 length:831 start_codon:yes stop_codon:yes gene_type:complete
MKTSKLKHNKKRNTAFLYESLVRELTLSIINKNSEQKKLIEQTLIKFFKKGTNLQKDLDSYKAIYETRNASARNAEKLLMEAKHKRFSDINEKELFNEQTSLIEDINKNIGKQTFSHFLPNYKNLATISQIFNKDISVKNKVLLENSVIKTMLVENKKETEMKPVGNIAFDIFLKKFNEKYNGTLLEEQQDLIKNYLFSFADNKAGLVMYLEEEMGRLEKDLKEAQASENCEETKNKLKLVQESVLNNKDKEINKEVILQILKVQELISEIKKDEA